MVGGGAVVGIPVRLFGVCGSSFATPVLSLLGGPPLFAVDSALPATLPSAVSGAMSYVRRKEMDWRVAWLSIGGALPATTVVAHLPLKHQQPPHRRSHRAGFRLFPPACSPRCTSPSGSLYQERDSFQRL